eukprot:6203641-Pleurochrysis_carterae.AAC.3
MPSRLHRLHGNSSSKSHLTLARLQLAHARLSAFISLSHGICAWPNGRIACARCERGRRHLCACERCLLVGWDVDARRDMACCASCDAKSGVLAKKNHFQHSFEAGFGKNGSAYVQRSFEEEVGDNGH